MPKQQIFSPLSYAEAVQASSESSVLIGEGVEADADRFFVDAKWVDAKKLYLTLEINNSARREKLAHCMLSCGDTPGFDLMGQGIEQASVDGLYLHLYCLGVAIRDSSVVAPQAKDILHAIYVKTKSTNLSRENLIMTLSSCAYLAVRSYQDDAFLLSIHASICKDLELLGSMYVPSLRLIPLLKSYNRSFNDQQARESIKEEMAELLLEIKIDSSPLLAIPFKAAQVLGDVKVKHSVIENLCLRYANDPRLESTISNTAVVCKSPDILSFLPNNVKGKSLDRPELKLLKALHARDNFGAFQISNFLTENKSYEPLGYSPCIVEPLFKYLFCDEDVHGIGSWSHMYFWEAEFADLLIEGLAPGADRKRHLRSIFGFISGEPSVEVVKELVELFEESPSYDGYLELPVSAFESLNPCVFARFLVDICGQYSDDDLCFDDVEWSWDRFLPALKDVLQNVHAEQRLMIESRFNSWGIPIQPTLMQSLNGVSLPESVRGALATLQSSLVGLEPRQLPYLQHVLNKIAATVPSLIAPAVANEVTICAYNRLICPRYLTKVGEERMHKLTKRYGAAGVLLGIEALMSSAEFDSQADGSFDALSTKLVELQGVLQSRRAYLAGVLRNRLKNLNTHWLDKQVVEAMKRGVDIEQMIDLAKKVTSWDMWSEGVESLQPY